MNKYGGQDPVAFIPNYVKDIGAEVFLSEDVEVEENNPYLYSENGCVYRRGIDGDTLIVFLGDFEKSWDEEFYDEEDKQTIIIRRHDNPKPYVMPENVAYIDIHNPAGWYINEIVLSKSFRPTASNLHSLTAARLSNILVDDRNPWLSAKDGKLYDKNGNTMLLDPELGLEESEL